ncbi:Uncharacterized protein ACO02O_02963 [Dirofilaria immitis]
MVKQLYGNGNRKDRDLLVANNPVYRIECQWQGKKVYICLCITSEEGKIGEGETRVEKSREVLTGTLGALH